MTNEEPEATTADFAAIARVSSVVALVGTRFTSIEAQTNAPADEVPGAWTERCFVGFRASADPRNDDQPLQVSVGFLAVYVEGEDLKYGSPPEYDPENLPTVVLEAEIELTYAVPGGAQLSDEDVGEFAEVNGTLHAWPYWREFAQSTSARMGITPLVVGNFRVPSPYDAPKETSHDPAGGDAIQ